MPSAPENLLISRNVTILGRQTSVRLEAQMWSALREVAERERCSVHDLCSLVATRRREGLSLTAAIRIFLMLYFKAATTEEGHMRAGHGGLDRMISRLMPGSGGGGNGRGPVNTGPASPPVRNGQPDDPALRFSMSLAQ